jgi:hypothetical protein
MKTPTIEEVKAYFKDAKVIECMYDNNDYENSYKNIFDDGISAYWLPIHNAKNIKICNYKTNKYAKIISYKSNPNIDLSKLTAELITELCKDENIKQTLINNGVIKNELEVNRWYRCLDMGNLIYYKSNEKDNYGLSYYKKEWSNDLIFQKAYNYELATPQEVETALKNEAVRRGFVKGVKYINARYTDCRELALTNEFKYDYEENSLYLDGNTIFYNGKWAELLKEETYIKIPLSIITLTDSDKKLGSLVRSISENY